MNNRFKELELKAIAYAESKVPADNRYNDIYHSIVRGKFAELIVQECAEVADNADATRQKWEGIGKYVREHFGVEE